MDSGADKKKKISRKLPSSSTTASTSSKGGRKSKKEDPIAHPVVNVDADAQLALAISESLNEAQAASNDDYQMHMKLQEEADAEYARQLADEFAAAEANHANNIANNLATPAAREPIATAAAAEGPGEGDDMDEVLEEIARMEAQERLKKTGHAYKGKANISRVLAEEDEEEAHIREKVKKEAELREWRAERDRQNAKFAEAQEQDRLRELVATVANALNVPIPMPAAPPAQPIHAIEPIAAPPSQDPEALSGLGRMPQALDLEPIPLNKDELRRARLAFFTNTKKA